MWSILPSKNACKADLGWNNWIVLYTANCLLWGGWASAFAVAQEPVTTQSPAAASTTAPPIPPSPSPQVLASKLLYRALHESVWGPPAHCNVRQSISVLGKNLTGFGRYVRAGQGSGKLRMSLQIPAGDQMNSLIQVSNGELLYVREEIGGKSRRTRVDLAKVRERLIITTSSLNDPVIAMYLAIGGQAEVLRKVCQQYEWTKVVEGKLGETPVWWIEGILTYDIPIVRALAQTDQKLFVKNRSGLLPSTVRLAIGRSETPVPFWLYQIEQRGSSGGEADAAAVRMHVVTEWVQPARLTQEQLSPSLFQVESTNEPFSEDTATYLPPAPTTARLPSQPALPKQLR